MFLCFKAVRVYPYLLKPTIPKPTCKSVAAHVHWEQTTAAISPVLTLRPAVLKCSLVMCVPPYLADCFVELGRRVRSMMSGW